MARTETVSSLGIKGFVLALYVHLHQSHYRDATTLANAIRDLREHSLDCIAEYKIGLLNNGQQSSQKWKHWINTDGSVSRTNLDFEYDSPYGARHDNTWTYNNSDLSFSLSTDDRANNTRPHALTYTAKRKPFERQRRQQLPPVDEAFGFLPLWDVYWDEVLTNKNAQITVRDQAPNATTLVATLAGTGEFEFTCNSTGDNLLLSEVAFKTSPDDLKDHKWFCAFQFRMSDIRYREFEGKPLIEGYRLQIDQTARNPDGSPGRSAAIEKKVRLVSFERLNETLTERISFPGVDLPDGTQVRVLNDPNVPHELRSGMIVRILPESSVIATKDARFRKPESSSSGWYLTLGIALLALVSLLVYRRWR